MIAAFMILALVVGSTIEASAQRYGWGGGGNDLIGGLIIGGIVGGIMSGFAPRPYYPEYYNSQQAYCMSRFRSYDPYSRTYLGFDGYRHYC
jgi:hypothetical protein